MINASNSTGVIPNSATSAIGERAAPSIASGREAHGGAWFAFYNSKRPHQGLDHRTPMAVWREGTTGAFTRNAVDMMDNARALPTCPQQQHQQQWFAMVG
jgi:hypothetical protein